MRPSVARALLRCSGQVPPRASLRGAAPLRWQLRETPRPNCLLSARRAGSRATYSTDNTPSDTASNTIPSTNTHWRTTLPFEYPPEFGFAFDIDGVLLRSSEPIEGATESLQFLQDNNIPFTLLTNGGGVHEHEKAWDVSAKLGVTIPPHSVVLSHTPFRRLVAGEPEPAKEVGRGMVWVDPDAEEETGLRNKNVFVTGSDPEKCRDIAENYGFNSVITPADILKWAPDYFPHDPMLGEDWRHAARALPRPIYDGKAETDMLTCLQIDAVLVFNEPRDWALSIQIITDLMTSYAGFLGTNARHNKPAFGPDEPRFVPDEKPPIYLANPDLIWSTAWHAPRLGMGAFNHALRRVWAELSRGEELEINQYGKPYAPAYAAAEGVLTDARMRRFHELDVMPNTKLERAYMVGDNPMSDIRGANAFTTEGRGGALWNSVLTCTGLSERWNRKYGEVLPPPVKLQNPSAIVNDVREAVRWALHNEGIDVRGKL